MEEIKDEILVEREELVLNEEDLYNPDSNGMCTVILDSSNIAYLPVITNEDGEEVVVYETVDVDDGGIYGNEEVKMEIDVGSVEYEEEYVTYQEIAQPRKTNRTSQKGLHKCSYCEKTFTQMINLVTHERIHTGEKPFICSVCEKPFSQQPNLWKHMRIHTGERPYQCSTCNKSFTQQANLTKHVRVHTGERPYGCQYCGKRFTQQANLTKHVRLHTGERPFHCSFCTKTFVQQSNLERHERTHTGVKPFQCKICFDSFAQNAHLTKHLRTVHKNHKEPEKYTHVMTEQLEVSTVNKGTEGTPEIVILSENEGKPMKKFGIPVLYCTKTGRILRRVDQNM